MSNETKAIELLKKLHNRTFYQVHENDDRPTHAPRELFTEIEEFLSPVKPAENIFNEQALRADLVKTWGPASAHVVVFDAIQKRIDGLYAELCQQVAEKETLKQQLKIVQNHK